MWNGLLEAVLVLVQLTVHVQGRNPQLEPHGPSSRQMRASSHHLHANN